MYFDFNFKSSILFVFFFHGIVFTILLLVRNLGNNYKANLWLSLFIALCTLFITPFMLGYAGWYSYNPYRNILFYIPFQQLLLLPPVLYFYTITLLDRSFFFSKKHLIHFIPAIIYIFYSLVIFLADKVILTKYYFYENGRDKDFDPWYQLTGFISMLCYLLASIRSYQLYRKIANDTVSYADEIKFAWIKRFLVVFILLLVIRVIFFIINPEWAQFGKKFWYYACFSVLFYYISINGYANLIRSDIRFNTDENPEKTDSNSLLSAGNDVAKTITNQEMVNLDLLRTKIDHLMLTNQAFKDPELTLIKLSNLLGVSTKTTSWVINKAYSMKFNDFVNYHRTQEVIKFFNSNHSNMLTLLGIAMDCGFNSKSTFNRAFKKHTAMTPKEFFAKTRVK